MSSAAAIENKERSVYNSMCSLFALDFLRNNKNRIAVLRLSGTIGKVGSMRGGGLTLEDLNKKIESAFGFPKLLAVCIIVNSPGGSPVQSELIASRIISLSKEKNVPVYCFVEDVAASGGYWLACAASKIFASKSSIIGSIGVVSAGFGLQDAIGKIGIERRIYTAGKNKSIMDPFLPAKDADIKILKKIQNSVHQHFIDYVKTRRGGKLTQSDDFLFNGEFWDGERALDYGLIDGIENFHHFVKREFGDKVKIEYITQKESWFKRKLGIFAELISQEISHEVKNSINEISLGEKYNLE